MQNIGRFASSLVIAFCVVALTINFLYKPVEDGTLHLSRANSHSVLLRQGEHKIHHIQAQSLEMAVYTQGFAHAQDRLWQMEKLRRMTQGRLSEIFGEEGVDIDQFSLTCGHYRTAKETWETEGLLPDEDRELLQAYADGVNDFIDGVGVFSDHQTSKLFPPELYALGIHKPEPWHPIDTLAMGRLFYMHLSFSWTSDLLRDIIGNLENGELRSIRDELVPFRQEDTVDLMTILNDDDLKQNDLYSEETLSERYKAAKQIREEEEEALNSKRKKFKAFIPEHETGFMESRATLDDQHASNAWAISGNYTKSGQAILAGDPHLGTDANTFFVIQHLEYQQFDNETNQNVTRFLVGAQAPGIPLISLGRSQDITWSITNPLTDVSDLYYETLNEKGTQYFVDGEWKDLKIEENLIYVKGRSRPKKFLIKHTHRGQIMDSDVITKAQVLFGPAQIPVHKETGPYSFVWSGNIPGDTGLQDMRIKAKAKDLFEYRTEFQSTIKKWNSVPGHQILSDSSGNIGAMVASPSPIRRNWYPHIGMNVIDGSTTKHDWEGITDIKNLPFVINPEKGYVVAANNRIVPDNSKFDFGAESISTSRGLRIRELIEKGIQEGKKFEVNDMLEMQNDLVDIVARDLVPLVVDIAQRALDDVEIPFDLQDRHDLKQMLDYMRNFKGYMGPNEIDATIWQYWNYFFYKSLFAEFTTEGPTEQMRQENNSQTWSTKRRILLSDHYSFLDYFKKLIKAIHRKEVTPIQNKICKYAFDDGLSNNKKDPGVEELIPTKYQGDQFCHYNVARCFIEAKQFLYQKISPNPNDWQWSKVHVNEYPMLPWSMTSLKPLWHREVPTGGNMNTISVSKTVSNRIEKETIFKATHAANYKMVVEYPDTNLMSIDTGMNGNLFAGNYFDMNAGHLKGNLISIPTDFKTLSQDFNNVILHIVPLQSEEKIEL